MRKPHTISEAPAGDLEQDVFGMTAAEVLDSIVDEDRIENLAAARKMRAATAWADLHRVVDPESEGHGSADPEVEAAIDAEAGTRHKRIFGWSFAGPHGIEGVLRLCGQNAYLVTEFGITELAARLGKSETAARHYVGQSLETRDRLPRLWTRVMSGDLPAWKARRIAQHTIPLGEATAAWVDAQLAPFAHKIGAGRIQACVDAAIVRFEPDLADEKARKAADGRGVWVEHDDDGTSRVSATTSTPDAVAFEHAVGGVASTLAALGDEDDLDIRRAKALGILADPQHALDLAAAADLGGRVAATKERRVETQTRSIHLHVHASLSDLAVRGWELDPVVRVDAPGVHRPVSITAVDTWLRDAAPGTRITITPVVDLNDTIVVDAYEAPHRLATQVDERDHTCQFPWCGRRGRYDKDHVIEYVDPDDGGPPGQTSSDNLARLCRFHHRVKTRTAWTYRRDPGGCLHWTSPHAQQYRVDHTGTTSTTST